MPPVQESMRKLLQAGKEFQKMAGMMMKYMGKGPTRGYPSSMMGGFCKAPFDTIGDTLRGTANIMKDMFRRPQKLLKALDVVADITINTVLTSPTSTTGSIVMYPLHKGADGWMSQKQFDTFYWPSLKKVMDAFIEEGLIQNMFAEGSYNTRLEYINEFPKGSVCWYFDRTDMEQAKKILGNSCCLQGNIPTSMIVTGQPEEVKKYCRWLIETCGKGGGYILSAGAVSDNPKLGNLRAIMETVKEYGFYRK
jgi:uroporphyrinogen-III decarboxylase